MNAITTQINEFRAALRTNAKAYAVQLDQEALRRLCAYYELLLTWNARLHLVAPCSPSEFATRHVLESLLLLPYLGPNARIADVGTGAGLPVIPNLIVRPDLQATLIESSKKKAVFLHEALRDSETAKQATVVAERFESLPTPEADHVVCRALDRFTQMLALMIRWCPPDSTLLLFGGATLHQQIDSLGLECSVIGVPGSERRYLFVCQNRDL